MPKSKKFLPNVDISLLAPKWNTEGHLQIIEDLLTSKDENSLLMAIQLVKTEKIMQKFIKQNTLIHATPKK